MAPPTQQQQQQQQQQQEQQEGWRLTRPKQRRPCLFLLLLLQLLQLLLLPECMGMETEQLMEGLSAAADDNVVRHRPAPVIGVLIQPVDDNLPHEISGVPREQLESSRVNYLAASYVKYIEAAGCVAMPIDLSMEEEKHRTLFSQLNGLLLPGGSADISAFDKPYLKTAKLYYDLAKEAMVIIGSGNTNYFTRMDDNNLDRRRVLTFSDEIKDSVLFGTADFKERMQTSGFALHAEAEKDLRGAPLGGPPPSSHQAGEMTQSGGGPPGGPPRGPPCSESEEGSGPIGLEALRSVFNVEMVKQLLATHPIAYFHHHRHISLEEYKADANLSKDWILLSTAKLPSEQAIEIVAAVEHKKYPFFGMQFHPEKALYEHCPKSRIPHFFLSLLPSLYLAAFIGLAARRSRNTFKCEKEKFEKIAFAYTPVRTAVFGQVYHFEQTYLFADINQTSLRGIKLPDAHADQQPPLVIAPPPRPQTHPQQQQQQQQQQQEQLQQQRQEQQQQLAAAAAEEA